MIEVLSDSALSDSQIDSFIRFTVGKYEDSKMKLIPKLQLLVILKFNNSSACVGTAT